MNEVFQGLNPERLWYYFNDILKIPRPSKNEEQITDYIIDFGKTIGLETIQDEVGNILIKKPATIGREKVRQVVLQSHIDMVCEKNSDVIHDFMKDPIIPYIDGEWIKAKGTTLGADDGIGIAAQLAILESKELVHGPIECFFTIDEESGMTGAFGLKPGFLQSEILLNLDSEDEGELFIGCAGGKDTTANFSYQQEEVPKNHTGMKLFVTGLRGGHSGDDIQKGYGNANKILNRCLWHISKRYEVRISEFNGGNLRNAIAREAYAVITLPEKNVTALQDFLIEYSDTVKNEYRVTEPELKVGIEQIDQPSYIIDFSTQQNLISALYACPHGVYTWSADIPDFVETSTNLAAVKTFKNYILITTSQRSSVSSAKEDICDMVASTFLLAGASVEHSDGYPGWKPNPHSEILEIARKSYEDLFKQEPKVLAIHAGLECGLIGETYPDLDMISYGPTIKGAHSPDERLQIGTVKKFWDFTLKILEQIPEK